MDELKTGGDAYTLITSLSPSLGDDSHYTIVLPISWAGVLDGILDGTGFISATSALIQPGTSLTGFLAAIPTTINITGMSDLLQFSGLSLDAILAALENTATELIGTDQTLYGQVVGGNLNVYTEVWAKGSDVTTAVTAVETSGEQNTAIVEDTNGNTLRLQEWNDGTNDFWGIQVPTGSNSSKIQSYALSYYRLSKSYSTNDVEVTELVADELTNVQLKVALRH